MANKENIEPMGDNRFRKKAENVPENVNVVTPVTEVKPDKLSAAVKMYYKHLANVKKYQQKNPEKMKEKSKRYMDKLKNDTTKYAEYLEKRRIYYKEVLKPKKQKRMETIVVCSLL